MPSGEREPENPREREQLLRDIARLSAGVRRLGFNLGSMRSIARAMDMFAAKRGNEVSAEDLEAAKRELVAALRGLRRQEAAHAERVSNLRFAAGAAALAALFGGAIVQRACDPIGGAHAYFAAPEASDVPSEETPESEEPQPFSPPPQSPTPQPPTPPPSLSPPPPAARQPARAPELTPDRPRARQHAAKAPRKPRESADTPAPFIVELTDSNFRSYTSRGIWVVDFYADWCGPCQAMKPVFDGLFRANRNRGSSVNFGQFRVNDRPFATYSPMVQAQSVHGIPTFVFFKDGREIGRLEGAGHTGNDFERILSGSRYEDPLEGIELDDL